MSPYIPSNSAGIRSRAWVGQGLDGAHSMLRRYPGFLVHKGQHGYLWVLASPPGRHLRHSLPIWYLQCHSNGALQAVGFQPPAASGPFAPVLARSGMDADNLIPVGRLLVGVSGPHEERVVKEAPYELHADRETS